MVQQQPITMIFFLFIEPRAYGRWSQPI